MPRYRPQYGVLAAILAAQALLVVLFSLMDDPLVVLAMLGGSLGSALILVQDAGKPRRHGACVSRTRAS